MMVALILDSVGSTELLFILVMALIFLGPRKLPQISRTLGKSLAEFRRASEDFKRTWEREVALESSHSESVEFPNMLNEENSILGSQDPTEPTGSFPVEAVPAEQIVARKTTPFAAGNVANTADQTKLGAEAGHSETPRKRDWL